MEKEVPPWLNKEYLETVLRGEGDGEGVAVSSFTARLAVAPGNNYLSHIFRVRVEYEAAGRRHSKSVMVKAPITKGMVSDMSDRLDVFGKELRAYTELLSRVTEKLGVVMSPTLYPSPDKALVLQDMRDLGYEMSDKHAQLDYAHCDLALGTLARFHAATVALHRDDPALIESLGEERMLVRGDPHFEAQFRPWLEAGVKIVAGIVAGMDGCQRAAEYMLQRVDGFVDSVTKICLPKEKGLNVLNHGDLWMNNMLFKHSDEGEVQDVTFIDFQILRYASPVTDIIYFIWTSAREDVRESRLEDLYHSYLKKLNETLELLDCEERLTEEEFHQDMKDASDWIMYSICNLLPMMQVETEDAINMEELNDEDLKMKENDRPDEKFLKMFYNKRYQALLPSMSKQFYKIVSPEDNQ